MVVVVESIKVELHSGMRPVVIGGPPSNSDWPQSCRRIFVVVVILLHVFSFFPSFFLSTLIHGLWKSQPAGTNNIKGFFIGLASFTQLDGVFCSMGFY